MRISFFLFLFLFEFCSNQFLIAESEAESRANARIFQDILDADEARINKEADRIYNEKKFGTHSSSVETEKEPSRNHLKSNVSWEDLVESFKYTILILSGGAFLWLIIVIFRLSFEKFCFYKRGGISESHWNSLPLQQKIFFQNRPKIRHQIDTDEYYKLVIEYNNCSCAERKNDIENILDSKKWGKPFLSGRINIEQIETEKITIFGLPCPQCKGRIDSSNLKEGGLYTCPHCRKEILFINNILENQGSLFKKYQSADADRKWEIYNIFKEQGWGKPY